MSLATVFPPGGKSGSEVTLTVAGSALEEIDRLHFSHPGITAAKKPEANAFAVTIGAEVPVGIYDVRVAGRQGISNPRVFVVGHLPEGVEAKANNQPDAAVELANGSVFNGTVPAAAREFFKISAKKGERLVVECAAGELDSRLSPVLAILDSMGKEISRGGGLLDFVAPADGDYRLQLHDLAFAGGPEYFYRLTLTNGPHVDFLFPAAGLPGTKSRFTLFGRNLPGSTPEMGLEKLEVEIELPASHDSRADGLGLPASAVIDGFSYRFNGVANPRFIAFAASPVIQEQEPNNRPAEAQPLPVPCEVAGRFYPAADSDSFTFEAKKGEVYWIEVFSSRSGVPTHPFLLVQHDKGVPQESYGSDVNAGGTRFNTAGGDPVVRFEVKEEGLHRILVRDLFGGTRNDPRGVYRLVVRRETPDFRLAAIVEFPPSKPDDRAAVPRASLLHGGGTSAVRVIALRQDNFNGEIAL
ncbi:MAG: hypothetical protein V4710_02735, partial [Verrucomicrobiota bacterium]